jgi:hypothetical protein
MALNYYSPKLLSIGKGAEAQGTEAQRKIIEILFV